MDSLPEVDSIDIPELPKKPEEDDSDEDTVRVELPDYDNLSNLQPPADDPGALGGVESDMSAPDQQPRHPLRVVQGGMQFTSGTQSSTVPGAAQPGAAQTLPQQQVPRSPLSADKGGITEREARDLTKTDDKPKDVYLPSGSMFQGILINGLDAVTSNANRRNPTPVLIRVKRDAILPNYYSLQIRECFVTAGGYGDMSTERAMMRTERISCVRDDGGVIDAPLDGYVIGEDGKVGMRGRLIMRQGDLLARAAFAGLLSGFAQALEPKGLAGITINADDGGTTTPASRYSTQDVVSAGVYGGISSASEKVADFYLELVDQMKPTIEIDAGRKATIVVVKGTNLKLG